MFAHLLFVFLAATSASAACINNSALSLSIFDAKDIFEMFPHRLRTSQHPVIRMAELKDPAGLSSMSRSIVNAIARILIVEALGYENVAYVQAKDGADAVAMLAQGHVDLSLEVWPLTLDASLSKALSEGEIIIDLGFAGYDGQDGFYIRPSLEDREKVMERGRWFQDFFKQFGQKAMAADEMIKYCTRGNCTMWTHSETCRDGGFCPGIVIARASKPEDEYMKDMLRNSSVDAALVYLDSEGVRSILEKTDTTVLMGWSFPSSRVHDDYGLIRLNFEAPHLCDIAFQWNRGEQYSCDFPSQVIRRAGSRHFVDTYADVAYFVEHMEFSAAELLTVWSAQKASSPLDRYGSRSLEDFACQWVKDHEDLWRTWIRGDDDSGIYAGFHRWILLFMVTIFFMLLWLCVPLCRTEPYTDVDPHYYGASEFWFYTAMWPGFFTSMFYCSKAKLKEFRNIKLSIELPKGSKVTERQSHLPRSLTTGLSKRLISQKTMASTASSKTLDLGPNSRYFGVASDSSCESDWDEEDPCYCAGSDNSEEPPEPPPSDSDFTVAERLAIARLQGYSRGRWAGAEEAVAREVALLAEGMQFSQKVFHGIAGDQDFKVALVCGAGRCPAPRVRVEIEHIDGTAHAGVDYDLTSKSLSFSSTQHLAEIYVPLYQATHRMSQASPWMPSRSFSLKITAFDEATDTPVRLGGSCVCKIEAIEMQQWPCPNATATRSFTLMRRQAHEIVKGNFKRECWWFIGMVWRALTSEVVNPLLTMHLVNDVLVLGSMRQAFVLVAIKLFCELCDHYSTYWFSVQGPICWVKPWGWIFGKWTSLPLEQCRNAETQKRFMGFAERLDVEYTSKTYNAEIHGVEYLVNLVFALIAMYFTSQNAQIAFAINLLVMAIGASIYMNQRKEKSEYAVAHAGEWDKHTKFLVERTCLFENAEFQNYLTGERDSLAVMATRRQRTIRRDEQWYLEKTQRGYIQWTMLAPWIFASALSPILVDFRTVSAGGIIALLGQFQSARTKVIELGSIAFKLIVASTTIKEFSELLNQDSDKFATLARCTAEIHQAQLREVARTGVPCMNEIRFLDCEASSDALRESYGDDFVVKCNGSCPFGGIYGLADKKTTDEGIRNRVFLDLVGGLRIPSKGAVLLPPGSRALVASSDVATIPVQHSVIDNLRYGLQDKSSHSEARIWALCQALGMDSHIFSSKCGHIPLSELTWAIDPLDRVMMNLVRALICMPEILIVHSFGELSPRRRRMMEIVLTNFVEGMSFMRLIQFRSASVGGLQNAGEGRNARRMHSRIVKCRTVLWMTGNGNVGENKLSIDPRNGTLQVLRGSNGIGGNSALPVPRRK